MEDIRPSVADSLLNRLPPMSDLDHDKLLPSLSSVTNSVLLDQSLPQPPQPPQPPSSWPTLSGQMPYRPTHFHHRRANGAMEMDADTASAIHSAAREQRPENAQNQSLNIEDPDVRLAAEALGDLRADFVSTPPDSATLKSASPASVGAPPRPPSRQHDLRQQPKPLLSLLTSHPLVASTVGGASSAYGGAKNFSPRFRSGVEYVEGYLTPIANTVNSVGRVTGVEGGVRWFLGGGRRHSESSDLEPGGSSKKRRKTDRDPEAAGILEPTRSFRHDQYGAPFSDGCSSRRLSSTSTIDTLPAYDEIRSPAYTETAITQNQPRSAPSDVSRQSRFISSTSDLTVAMSAESLRSLKYCLKWLRWSNHHMGRVIRNLKAALEDYEEIDPEQARPSEPEPGISTEASSAVSAGDTRQQSRLQIVNKIDTLKGDIVKTLRDAIETVSTYTGGALPLNARDLVRRHITSLPQRFHIANMTSEGDSRQSGRGSTIRDGAQRVLVLAREGLDMVTQVSAVVDGTITSAEEWCERMGGNTHTLAQGGVSASMESENAG